MKSVRSFAYYLTIRVFLLIISCSGLAYCLVRYWWYGLFLVPLIIYQCYYLVILNKSILNEFNQLVETIRYRDFSRRFNTKKTNFYIRDIRTDANEIYEVISAINREKEIQYQFLQTIIELVDTGILSYDMQTGQVIWINQALKNLLNIPFLKNFHTFKHRNPVLYEKMLTIDNKKNAVLSVFNESNQSTVLVSSSIFTLQNTEYRLFAFHEINKILDEAESKAWQRLLNVMTHEIMNSVAPISSLAGTLKNLMVKIKETPDNSSIGDIELGIDTIMRRSHGLLSFAKTYRNLSKISKLNMTGIRVGKLFEHICRLMQPSLTQKNINLEIILDNSRMTIEAVKSTPEPLIILSATYNKDRPVLKVIDNGSGIADDITDKIFIPFFSTRKHGNGIGLSLCKQIMLLHNGNIQMNTIVDKGTCFSLLF